MKMSQNSHLCTRSYAYEFLRRDTRWFNQLCLLIWIYMRMQQSILTEYQKLTMALATCQLQQTHKRIH